MDIAKLIDAAARAAVEHNEASPVLAELFDHLGTKRRTDGTYAVTDKIVDMYFPESERLENAVNRREYEAKGWSPDTFADAFTPTQMRESAFRQVNYAILTNSGVSPVAARETINAAIERGNI